jgi:alpha-beta hydrolase superfamily lysophospholipase
MYNFTLKNDDINLNIVTHDVTSPVGVLIHVHGLLDDFHHSQIEFYNFNNRLEYLKGLNLVHYAIELRNHGASTKTSLFQTTFAEYVSDVRALVLHVKEKHPTLHKKIHMFGSSMGGAISILHAMQYGGIASLILSAPLIGLASKLQVTMNTTVLFRYLMGTSVTDEYVQKYDFLVREVSSTLKAFMAQAPTFNIPTCAFHSKIDALTNHKSTETFIHAIKTVDKKLVIFEQGQHELLKPNSENDRTNLETVKKTLLAWLKERV